MTLLDKEGGEGISNPEGTWGGERENENLGNLFSFCPFSFLFLYLLSHQLQHHSKFVEVSFLVE